MKGNYGGNFGMRLLQLTFVPSLVIVALLAMYLRTGQIMTAVEDGTVLALLAPAQAVAETTGTQAAPDAPPIAALPPSTTGDTTAAVETLTDEDIAVLQQLAGRRAELDKRMAELDQREVLVKAAEQKLDEKFAELQKSRQQLEALLNQATAEQATQAKSLVKIYETMKPAQAAKIFEQLDLPVLLKVVESMKEAKAAPVLAAMDPQKAKIITTELMRKRELPQLPTVAP